MLKELHNDLHAASARLQLACMCPPVRDLLDHSGVTGAISEEHIYGRVLEGVVLHLSERHIEAEMFLGVLRDALKGLQEFVIGMLVHAEGVQQT